MKREPEDLTRYLNGELPFADLPPALREEALKFEGLVAALDREPIRLPSLRSGVEALIRAEPMPKWRRLWDWFRTPRLSPLTAGLTAVAGALAWLMVPSPAQRVVPVSAVSPVVESQIPLRTIRFTLEAPGASTVVVTGDFLEWRPEGIPLHRLPSGEWAGEVDLPTGVHHYAFVVDGREWVTDPAASSRVDDGFGHENSLLVVPAAAPVLPPSATS
jgi:hypothetical protein